MLEVEGLRKRFGEVVALDGLDLAVAAGEVVGLVGHNGAGKTTAVEVVTGLVRPDAGRVRVAGVDALARPREARAHLGVAAQELQLYLTATVRQNVALCAALAGVPRRARAGAVRDVLDELVLGTTADRPVALLSGGQRRRVQAACALVGTPHVLLLDEPTVGADPQTRSDLLAAVRVRAARGAAVLYTTHYLPELVELGASLAVVQAGRVVARGGQDELLGRLPSRVEVTVEAGGAAPEDPRPGAAAADPVDALVAALPVGDNVAERGPGRLVVRTPDPGPTLARLAVAGPRLATVDVQHASLDDLFAALGAADAREAGRAA